LLKWDMENHNNAIVAVYCFVEKEGKILLTREVGKPGFKFPGGKAEQGENVLKTGKKEVMEEIGVEIKMGDLVYIQEYLGNDHRMRFFYRAQWLSGEIVCQKEEIEGVEWKTIEEIAQMTETDFFQKIYYLAAMALVKDRTMPEGCFEILENENGRITG